MPYRRAKVGRLQTASEVILMKTAIAFVVLFPLFLQHPEMKLCKEFIPVTCTSYSSSTKECDNDPYITATGAKVKIGGVAVSRSLEKLLPIGARFMMEGKVYEVNDRTNRRFKDYLVDIWQPTEDEAWDYGRQRKTIVIWKVTKL